jgi:hypothetical protein
MTCTTPRPTKTFWDVLHQDCHPILYSRSPSIAAFFSILYKTLLSIPTKGMLAASRHLCLETLKINGRGKQTLR